MIEKVKEKKTMYKERKITNAVMAKTVWTHLCRPIRCVTIALVLLLSQSCNTTAPKVEHVCHGDYDIIHGEMVIHLERDLTEEQVAEFISDYSEYGLKIIHRYAPDLNFYYCTFDHKKVHCLLFQLMIWNDERATAPYISWLSQPTTWTPGYLHIRFQEFVTDEMINDFINDNAEYELEIYNVLVPRIKLYLFSYDFHKLTNLN